MPKRPAALAAGAIACAVSHAASAAEPLLGQAARTFGALVFVLGLMAVLAWVTRRLRARGGFTSGNRLRVVESMPLGMRDKLLLVEADGTTCLIGVGQSGIQSLALASCPRCGNAHAEEGVFGHELASSRTALADSP